MAFCFLTLLVPFFSIGGVQRQARVIKSGNKNLHSTKNVTTMILFIVISKVIVFIILTIAVQTLIKWQTYK